MLFFFYLFTFFNFFCFPDITMYILNIATAIKKCQSMKSETFTLKTIITELYFLRKTVVIQFNIRKKMIYNYLQLN